MKISQACVGCGATIHSEGCKMVACGECSLIQRAGEENARADVAARLARINTRCPTCFSMTHTDHNAL